MCLCVFMFVDACPEEGAGSPGVTGDCELPDKGAGHQTPVLSKRSKRS